MGMVRVSGTIVSLKWIVKFSHSSIKSISWTVGGQRNGIVRVSCTINEVGSEDS